MSSRKLKQNNENLCPLASKRTKSTDSPSKSIKSKSTWVTAKLESTSSPTGLTEFNEYLEEMGVGILDSEESSSSASSAMSFVAALAAFANTTDENCNESKFNQQQQRSTTCRSLSQTPDKTFDANNSLNVGNEIEISSSNNNSNASIISFDIFTDESSPQAQSRKACLQHKAVTNLIESPSKRSPLATVAINSQNKNSQQTQLQQQTSPSLLNLPHLKNDINTPSDVILFEPNLNLQRSVQHEDSLSPQQPSTSRQAALMKQQQQLYQLQKLKREQLEKRQQHQEQCNQQQIMTTKSTEPQEEFFLFRRKQITKNGNEINYFNMLSDEIILHIFKWLPKKALLRCGSVCRRFNQCASDESLWARLDLGGRSLRPEAIYNVLTRGVVILRLAQTNFNCPVFSSPTENFIDDFQSKLQFLDLSVAQIDKVGLRTLLSYCRQLKKLSLEHVPLNNDICNEIAQNTNLEALNLAMCTGLEAWSVRNMFTPLKNLNSLNISWTNLSVDAVTSLVTHLTPNLIRLNVAGCRKTMFDTHISSLAKHCPQLIELDISDCTGLTGSTITTLSDFKMLEYLSISRCYLIPCTAYLDLKNCPTLAFLDVFGTLSDDAISLIKRSFPGLGINKFIHSSVARPTVGSRRTSIWGLRTRD